MIVSLKVTLKQVSEYCNLSTATVSNVLNGTKPVKPETREKVMNAIKELGYIPDEAARQLKMGSSRLIGVLTIGYNYFFTEILEGIERQAEELGWKIMVGSTDESYESQQVLLDSFISRRVEGIIIAPTHGWTKEKLERYRTIPLVFIDRKVEGCENRSITVNNLESSKQAVMHLVEKHHYRRIGLIYADTQISTMDERKQGYEEALKQSGLAVKSSLIRACDGSVDGGKNSMDNLLKENSDIEAVYVTNNNMLQGAYKSIQEKGLRVPDDIAIIGIDVQPWMEFMDPKLTIIQQPVRRMGEQAITKLLHLKENKEVRSEELKNILILGESCGCNKEIS